MDNVRVIRVEHYVLKETESNNVYYMGCYRNRFDLPDAIQTKMGNVPRPDREWWDREECSIFAFRNVEALKQYFTPDVLEHLSKIGFVLAIYEIPAKHVMLDTENVQCAFNPAYAKKIKRKVYKGEDTIQSLAA